MPLDVFGLLVVDARHGIAGTALCVDQFIELGLDGSSVAAPTARWMSRVMNHVASVATPCQSNDMRSSRNHRTPYVTRRMPTDAQPARQVALARGEVGRS